MKKKLFDSDNINPLASLVIGYLAICVLQGEAVNPFPIIGDFFTGIFNGEVGIGDILSVLFTLFLVIWLGMIATVFIVKPIYLILNTFFYTYRETFIRIRHENFFYWLVSLPFRLIFLPIIRSVLTIMAGGEAQFDSTIKRLRVDTLTKRIKDISEQMNYLDVESDEWKKLKRLRDEKNGELQTIRSR